MSDPIRITVCMGSSCFARGNNRNIEVVQDWLRGRALEGAVELQGQLCGGACAQGPNVLVESQSFHGVQPAAVAELLARHVGERFTPVP